MNWFKKNMWWLRRIVELPIDIAAFSIIAFFLVRLLPGWTPRREIIHAVFPSRRGLLPSVRLLIDHLAASFQALEEE